MAWAALAVAAAQVISSYQQADSIRESAKLQRKIDELNAEFIDIDAYEAEKAGFSESARYQNVIDSTVSDQRVAYASQNVDVSFGTAAQVQAETKLTGELNILDIQKNAYNKALGLKQQANNVRLGSKFSSIQSDLQANSVQTAGLLNAGATYASGYGKK